MKIAMIAGESRPFCKTGGLADVTYSLSKELVKMGEELYIVLPFYDVIKKQSNKYYFDYVTSFDIKMSWRTIKVNVSSVIQDGIKYFFIENQSYFERGHLYGDFDDGERFAFFSIAAKELFIKLKIKLDIIHVHDWHVGMIPCLIKEDPKSLKFYKNTKFVLSIHNPAFQGLFPKICLGDLYNLSDELFDSGKVRFKDQLSTLKSAIVYADKITTVSPTHHYELLTSEGSMGLSDVLKFREFDFVGILNGIDYQEFDPHNDKYISSCYDENNVTSKKKINKKDLLNSFSLPINDGPVYSLVSRLSWQKGLDILFKSIEELAKNNAKVIILGSGEANYENYLQELRNRYPNNVGIFIGYDDKLAHKIYAGSDFFLMPSLFEPCGLSQMISERYGTLPIVRRTGGLKDSVINYDGNNISTANGFGFDSYSEDECLKTCFYANETYKNKELMKKLINNAMRTNNTWNKSANEYLSLYKSIKK